MGSDEKAINFLPKQAIDFCLDVSDRNAVIDL